MGVDHFAHWTGEAGRTEPPAGEHWLRRASSPRPRSCPCWSVRYSRQNGAALWRSFEALQNEVRKRLLFAGEGVTLRWGNNMTLDWHVCSRARLSRDPRFDGKFFIGVLGSRVYCRPICPAPTAKEKNVSLFSDRGCSGRGGLSPLLAMPAGVFARNSGVAGNVQHRLASFAPDRGERLGERRDGSSRRAPGSWHATSSQAVHPASGRDSNGSRSDATLAFRKEAD